MGNIGRTFGGIAVAVLIFGIGYYMGQESKQLGGKIGSSLFAPPAGKSTTVKIGVLLPLTGDAADKGKAGKQVMQLAADEINKEPGKGNKLELVFEDSKCDGSIAAGAMQKFANVDKVAVVIGGFCDGDSLAALPIAKEKKILLLSATASGAKLSNASEYFFRIYPNEAGQGAVLANNAVAKKWTTVAVMQEKHDVTASIFKTFQGEFAKKGGKVVKEEFAANATDLRTRLISLRAKNPQALFIDGQTSTSAERVVKELKNLKWRVPLMVNEAFTRDTAAVARNAVSLEGAITVAISVDLKNEKYTKLQKTYKDAHKSDLPFPAYAQTEYDAVFLLADGIRAVGYDGVKLVEWSRTVKDWKGASGNITIEKSGDRTAGYELMIIKGGKIEAIK